VEWCTYDDRDVSGSCHVKHWRTWLVGILLVWLVAVTWWAVRPVSETVPTGMVKNVQTYQTVQCNSPLSGGSATESLPTLGSGRAYEYTPCQKTVTHDRVVYAGDVALVIAVLIVLAATRHRPRRSGAVEVTTAA
jgi:hypothetical protein